jgi:hypothetical protein
MDIFQRSIHSNVKKIDDDHLQVASSLLDLEHSFNLDTQTLHDAIFILLREIR